MQVIHIPIIPPITIGTISVMEEEFYNIFRIGESNEDDEGKKEIFNGVYGLVDCRGYIDSSFGTRFQGC